jgi:hypothetical protein
MIIDRTHRRWALASAAILAVAIAVYVPYALRAPRVGGGTPIGLAYGVVGFSFMVFVTLLSVRKKFPIWRIGRAQTWMRGHLWLGALSLPLILLHAGWLFGHGLTSVLMWLFVVVYVSGCYGAWLQHTMPRRLMRDVPMETIYEQIDHVRAQLVDEADTVVADACGRLEVAVAPAASGATALASVMRVDADVTAPLREFYVQEMRPFVQAPTRRHPLADASTALGRFDKLRPLVPASLHPAVADLESICEEERQLMRQERLHGALHAWLLVHVPASFALMALSVAHIIGALRY